jgi:hypothetical protein
VIDMAHHLNAHLTDRRAFPFAVGVCDKAGQVAQVYVHFQTAAAAEFFASCVDGEDNTVLRYVAVLSPHIVASTTLGWRSVDSFTLDEVLSVSATQAHVLYPGDQREQG